MDIIENKKLLNHTPRVSPSPSAITLDGSPITLNAYLFPEGGDGSNYVMLRDVAYLLNGTSAQFEVTWNKDNGITIATSRGKAYTSVGGELVSKVPGSKAYTENRSTITINGKPVTLKSYTIEGYNYFKLRDMAQAISFQICWTAEKDVYIESGSPYSE